MPLQIAIILGEILPIPGMGTPLPNDIGELVSAYFVPHVENSPSISHPVVDVPFPGAKALLSHSNSNIAFEAAHLMVV